MNSFQQAIRADGEMNLPEQADAWIDYQGTDLADNLTHILRHDDIFNVSLGRISRQLLSAKPDAAGICVEAAVGRMVKDSILRAIEREIEDELEFVDDMRALEGV